jgi:hypothetical protein
MSICLPSAWVGWLSLLVDLGEGERERIRMVLDLPRSPLVDAAWVPVGSGPSRSGLTLARRAWPCCNEEFLARVSLDFRRLRSSLARVAPLKT